jgi:hypothetical protein
MGSPPASSTISRESGRCLILSDAARCSQAARRGRSGGIALAVKAATIAQTALAPDLAQFGRVMRGRSPGTCSVPRRSRRRCPDLARDRRLRHRGRATLGDDFALRATGLQGAWVRLVRTFGSAVPSRRGGLPRRWLSYRGSAVLPGFHPGWSRLPDRAAARAADESRVAEADPFHAAIGFGAGVPWRRWPANAARRARPARRAREAQACWFSRSI